MLGNIPLLRRLRTVLLANNRISSISASLHLSVPNLTTLVLTNNNIAELGDLEPLKDVKSLQYLSLLGNPVREKKYYREWLAWRIPNLRVLDFQRIREKVCLAHAIHQDASLTSRLLPEGAANRAITLPDGRQPANPPRDNDLADGLYTLVKTARYDG